MPSIPLHLAASLSSPKRPGQNSLPSLLQTPSGLAILEIQGTLHVPPPVIDFTLANSNESSPTTPAGHLEFPLYDASDPENTSWMKRVYFYVGKHQRLTGEVKRLPKPVAVIRRRAPVPHSIDIDQFMDVSVTEEAQEELEVVEIVRFKLLFASRPEPVGSSQ